MNKKNRKVCLFCGEEYPCKPSRAGVSRYCSHECRGMALGFAGRGVNVRAGEILEKPELVKRDIGNIGNIGNLSQAERSEVVRKALEGATSIVDLEGKVEVINFLDDPIIEKRKWTFRKFGRCVEIDGYGNETYFDKDGNEI